MCLTHFHILYQIPFRQEQIFASFPEKVDLSWPHPKGSILRLWSISRSLSWHANKLAEKIEKNVQFPTKHFDWLKMEPGDWLAATSANCLTLSTESRWKIFKWIKSTISKLQSLCPFSGSSFYIGLPSPPSKYLVSSDWSDHTCLT